MAKPFWAWLMLSFAVGALVVGCSSPPKTLNKKIVRARMKAAAAAAPQPAQTSHGTN